MDVPPPDTAFPPPPPLTAMPPPPPPLYGYPPQAPAVPQVVYGGFWIRVAAYIIDSLIVGAAGFVLGFVLAIAAVIGNPDLATNPNSPAANTLNVVSDIVAVILSFAYYAGLWTLSGATFGQRWLRLRVVDAATFQPVTMTQAALRWLGLLISLLACFVGAIWVAFDPRKQGWMDKIAGTVVVQLP